MNNFLNLAHLKFFCDTVIYQSISEAAKINFITQSAVSQAINKLESVFGAPLLIHNKQKLTLTDQGKIVFDQAIEITKSINDTFQKVNQTKGVVTGTLSFATTKSLGMSFFAPTYSQIKKNLPHLDIKINMGGKSYIRTALKRQEVEFAIVVYDHNFSQFAKHTIKQGHFNLYQSAKGPKKQFEQEVFVDESEGMYVSSLREFFSENDHLFEIKAISGWELVANFSNLGIGQGFFPDYIASEARFPNVKQSPLKLPLFKYEIAAIYNNFSELSNAARAFIEQFTLE
jgi:DNA-binding transcriptional LysR family regulator